ncbi:hypothetical protein ACHZG4_001030 [Yersinia enterocolitica]|nr:succinylglutamate desuccinylase/aspartoacylase family protein [Yersinia enterocolitica]ELI8060425.1 succinylglutamate desuccinylase/aspartoacylase family protein [Yersinia enterocolitica]
MSKHSSYSKRIIGQAGIVSWGQLFFSHPTLAGLELPYFDIEAPQPGPKLAIIAGMHPNEVSAMEAALRLKNYFADQLVHGSVSILPVLNMPGLYLHSELFAQRIIKTSIFFLQEILKGVSAKFLLIAY